MFAPVLVQVLFALSAIPRWFWVSTLITLWHTADEASGTVTIWEFFRIPASLYFLFQGVVLYLGLLGNLYPGFAPLFIAVRMADLGYTHIIRQAPGGITSPLLFLDAVAVAYIASHQLI